LTGPWSTRPVTVFSCRFAIFSPQHPLLFISESHTTPQTSNFVMIDITNAPRRKEQNASKNVSTSMIN